MIDHLGGFNSHQHPYTFANKKSLQNISTESLSTSIETSSVVNRSGGHQNIRSMQGSDSYKQEISE